MRIGIDARLWNETGVGRYIRNLVWELEKLDQKKTYVLFVTKDIDRKELPRKKNWQVIETDIRWHTIKEQIQFPKVLEKENLDLVHFPYFSVPIFYNRPFVITIHDLIINHYPTGKASTLPSPLYYLKVLGYKFIIRKAAQKAQKVITVSEATKSEIVKHLSVPSEKIIVTYEGVDENVASSTYQVLGSEKNKNTLYMLHNTRYFLYVGNAYPHKNLERLMEAFGLIAKENPEVHLVLVGKKNYFYDRLEEKVHELQLTNNVTFVGSVSDEELVSLYQHAEALIFPSLMEGFGLPGLEAMQQNCLVLASDIPSLREVYHDAAVYFDPRDVNSMHDTIRAVLLDKNKFASYLTKGKKRVTAFSWRKMAEETIKIYESSIGIRSNQ
jgi:glycosyltransferase involved in cell wall biosynthesis